MKILVKVLFFSLLLLVASGAYAYFLANKQSSTKVQSLLNESETLIGDATRGEYVATMGGCIACHTDFENNGEMLAGGVSINTPFGTFYSPNITSDNTAGIGQWSQTDFLNAMSVGISPNEEHYFPAFPYTSYSVMAAQDLLDLKAWLDTVKPVSAKAPEHDITWPFSSRNAMVFWKALFFEPRRISASKDRGRYLVEGPGHCAECHAPRNLIGGVTNRTLTGNARGPDGDPVPAITSDDLIDWSLEDLTLFLEVGITLSGDFTGGHMAYVVEHSTSLLNDEDRTLIAEYLLSEANKP